MSVSEIARQPRMRPGRTTTRSGAAPTGAPRRMPYPVLMAALIVAAPVSIVAGIGFGAVGIPLSDTWTILTSHLVGREPPVAPVDDQIIWRFRTPRVLLAFVTGAGLAVAGAVLQAVVRNPLADPYVLGVSSGASFAAVAMLTLAGATTSGFFGAIGVSGAAFVGAMLSLVLVVLLGRSRGALDPHRLLLAGVALGYLLQAGTSYLQLRASPDQMAGVLFWLLGSVSSATWSELRLPTLVVVVCCSWLILQGRKLNALLLGDEAATALGVDVARFRLQLLLVAALLTAVVIAVAGGVGFVGLIAPHCIRLLVGPEHRRLLPATALLGGVFLVLADLAGRTVAQPLELPLSVVTAVAGVPFFLVLLRRSGAI